ncbi:MAG: hypothetical protein JSV86_17195 [Gemmatimonadota bacterium]|nr:MAG: hypothetical protein JSV86_17195 [Gemmatimonadota bacterium]
MGVSEETLRLCQRLGPQEPGLFWHILKLGTYAVWLVPKVGPAAGLAIESVGGLPEPGNYKERVSAVLLMDRWLTQGRTDVIVCLTVAMMSSEATLRKLAYESLRKAPPGPATADAVVAMTENLDYEKRSGSVAALRTAIETLGMITTADIDPSTRSWVVSQIGVKGATVPGVEVAARTAIEAIQARAPVEIVPDPPPTPPHRPSPVAPPRSGGGAVFALGLVALLGVGALVWRWNSTGLLREVTDVGGVA